MLLVVFRRFSNHVLGADVKVVVAGNLLPAIKTDPGLSDMEGWLGGL